MEQLKSTINGGSLKYLLLVTSILVSSGILAQDRLELWEIQGDGNISPYDGQLVESIDNIVTAKTNDGFFIQTPADRSDRDSRTSDGLFVDTGGNANVTVGDRVDVRGFIKDRGGLTRFDLGSNFSVRGTGADLPPGVPLNIDFPGPSPTDSLSLEQVEGMRVRVEGVAGSPSNFFGEFAMTATDRRTFREPGIRYPGLPGLPVWDGNPELFWVDPDGAGAADNRLVTPGTIVAATGVLGFQFNKYTLFPEGYTLQAAPAGRQVRQKRDGEYTVASLNAFLLLQSEPGYQRKLRKLARYIVEFMDAPDIIALQEVDNLTALNDLIREIKKENSALSYTSYFQSGPDDFNVGFLTSSRTAVDGVEQLGRSERDATGRLLHNRPPLCLTVRLGDDGPPLQLINVHIRSRIGIEGNDSTEVRRKRYDQGLSIARMVRERQENNLIVLGDFNAYQFTDGYADIVNQIAGRPGGPALFPYQEIVELPLRNLTATVDSSERYSFIFDGNAQLFDHCLASAMNGLRIEELQFARGNADAPFLQEETETNGLRSSDHDGFVLFLQTDQSVATNTPPSLPGVILQHANPLRAGAAIFVNNTSGEPIALELYNQEGRPLQQWTLRPAGQQSFALPKNLPAGSYVLSLWNGLQRITCRLIVI